MKRWSLMLCLAALLALPVAAYAAELVPAAAAAPRTAIVTLDRTPLRAAPRESAQLHASLWAGDSLEVRGVRLDYLQVYDHRRERAGFVRANRVRVVDLQEAAAPELRAVLRFLRDSPGDEALGIGYAAAFLRAAPAVMIDAEVFDALGVMADRLARRASANRQRGLDEALAAQVEVAVQHGVRMLSYEHEGRMQLCYEGEAFRRVLALPSNAEQKARAALALTRHECVDPDLPPLARFELDEWRAQVLERMVPADLPEHWRNRLHLRAAGVWSSIAFARSRRGGDAQQAAERALQEFAAVDRQQLAEEDAAAYEETAIRVGASRWAAVDALPAAKGLSIRSVAGQAPGETCAQLIDDKRAAPLLQRCTFGTAWTPSVRVNPQASIVTLAVQPLSSWRELWVFQRNENGWRVDVVPPGVDRPELGYLEFAGWVPGKPKLLVAREIKREGRCLRSFEILDLRTLKVDKQAADPSHLSLFYRWQDPAWKRQTVALR